MKDKEDNFSKPKDYLKGKPVENTDTDSWRLLHTDTDNQYPLWVYDHTDTDTQYPVWLYNHTDTNTQYQYVTDSYRLFIDITLNIGLFHLDRYASVPAFLTDTGYRYRLYQVIGPYWVAVEH